MIMPTVRAIGCNTWNANANENSAWLNNPHRKGEDDMGPSLWCSRRQWQRPDGSHFDQFTMVDNLT